MKRTGVVMLMLAAILALALGLVLAQGGAPEGGRAGGRFDPAAWEQERLSGALTQAGLIGAERAAAEAAVKAKQEARRELTTALEQLRGTAEDAKASNDKLKQAIATYQEAMGKYRRVVEAQDKALVDKLSVRSQARCLAVGILDNGLGMSGRPPRRGGGGPPAGGPPAPPG